MVYSAKSDDINTISQFTRRKDITITTGGTSTPANYQVKVTITYESEMQADFDDIRFNTKAGGYIDYWIESKTNSVTATVWIELPDAIAHPGSDTVWMYYGNASLSDAGNGNDVFISGGFDDFNDASFDTGKWTKYGNAASVYESGGVLNIDYFGSFNPIVKSNTAFGIDTIFTARLKSPVSPYLIGFSDQTTIGSNPLNAGNGLYMQPYTASDIQITNTLTGTRTNAGITPTVDINYHEFKIIRNSTTNAKYYYDGSYETIISDNLPTGNLAIGFFAGSTNGMDMDVDYIYIRKYIADEPTPTYGTSQHQRKVPQFIN